MRLSVQHPAFAGLIGVAREDITPPVGIYARNWGAATSDIATGVHRPLTATALTLQQDREGAPLVIVALDLGWWRTREDELFVRTGLLEALDLDPARLLINLSHTHAGPSICRADADKPGGHLIASYLDQVRASVIRVTQSALQSAAPARLEWSYGRSTLAHNRDLPEPRTQKGAGVSSSRLSTGRASRFVCGYNPHITVDDEALVGRVCGTDGAVRAVVVNYACHPTTLAWENHLISPDYVGAMREVVERHYDGALCLFLQGASGELAPCEQYTGDPAIADKNGMQLGFAVLSALQGMLPSGTCLAYSGIVESGAPLAVWRSGPTKKSIVRSDVRSAGKPTRSVVRLDNRSADRSARLIAVVRDVTLPLKAEPSLEEIDRRLQTETDPAQIERLRRRRRITQIVGDGPTTTMPLWVWRIGEMPLVAQPNEAYSLLQTELRTYYPAHIFVVMNTTNGPYCGYLPPADRFDQDLYPVWQTPFARGCLETVMSALGDAILVIESEA